MSVDVNITTDVRRKRKKMNYIGMDIHKQFTFAVAKDEQGIEICEDKFENSKANFQSFLLRFKPEETRIVMESTGVWEYIYSILESLNYSVKLANPFKTKAIAYAKIKTDKVDASMLSDLLRANLIAESYIPPKEVRILREMIRMRKMAVKQKTQCENRLHALLTKKGISLPKKSLCKGSIQFLSEIENEPNIKEYLEIISFLRNRVKNFDKQVEEEAVSNENALILMSFPGIGCIHAMEIISEIGDIKRFQTADKLCSYAGLVPSIRQSGNTLHLGSLMKQSSRTLKHSFIQTAWIAIGVRESNPLQEFYKKLAKKKGKQKAICAVARKICCVVYAMLTKKEQYRYS